MQTALITGSTSGIGLGVATHFAKLGYNIILNGFGDAEAATKEVETFCALGNKVAFVGADLMHPADCRRMIEESVSKFGTLDVVINNAGIQYVCPIDTFPDEKWDQIMALNLSSVFHTTKAVLPHMRKQDFGRIINIASVHGLVGSAHKSAYVAAKHGVIGFTKATALDLANTNITVNAVCPGWVHTPLVQKQFEARAARENISVDEASQLVVGEKMPTRKCASSEEIAMACAYLAAKSSVATRGIALPVDGCWTAQ